MLTGLAPVWRPEARLLIVGSFPGAASLQAQQYYAHPRNAFWPLIGTLLGLRDLPSRPYEQRLQALVEHRIALWDAVAACERPGSLDADIRDARPSDLAALAARLPALQAVACNGAKAYRQAAKLLPSHALLPMPSTSPAHAGLPFAAKCASWRNALLEIQLEFDAVAKP